MAGPKRPRDPNQLAKLMLDIATGEVKDTLSEQKKNPPKRGRAGGLSGGKARAAKLHPSERRKIAKQAADIRWSKTKKP
jgi:hypothetical protein